ncbi:hypothetical protein BDV29DRAFT_174108 [Aspergillus leporis]|jgi:hypothetical protein|uniref:Secreted protein n=1 Tax=Aspergillus leporis TaxID=41062 RepID=A0A5N5X064_9EURO|nr:hypothetical protein BDV29DRAFT_174108 [Aspergillus leporis]
MKPTRHRFRDNLLCVLSFIHWVELTRPCIDTKSHCRDEISDRLRSSRHGSVRRVGLRNKKIKKMMLHTNTIYKTFRVDQSHIHDQRRIILPIILRRSHLHSTLLHNKQSSERYAETRRPQSRFISTRLGHMAPLRGRYAAVSNANFDTVA